MVSGISHGMEVLQMPECHKCPYNGKGSAVCLTCKGPAETNHQGQTFVSIDACSDGGQSLGEVAAVLHREPDADRMYVESVSDNIRDDAAEAARSVAFAFVSLSELEFYLVQRLMRGNNMAQIGKMQGMTRAAISARVKKLVEKHAVFKFLRLEN